MKEWFKSVMEHPAVKRLMASMSRTWIGIHKETGTGNAHYRVFLLGAWRDVPDAVVITEPNWFGPAVVWPVYSSMGSGKRDVAFIRCFLPGAGS
jgi:hypothetical protein